MRSIVHDFCSCSHQVRQVSSTLRPAFLTSFIQATPLPAYFYHLIYLTIPLLTSLSQRTLQNRPISPPLDFQFRPRTLPSLLHHAPHAPRLPHTPRQALLPTLRPAPRCRLLRPLLRGMRRRDRQAGPRSGIACAGRPGARGNGTQRRRGRPG